MGYDLLSKQTDSIFQIILVITKSILTDPLDLKFIVEVANSHYFLLVY